MGKKGNESAGEGIKANQPLRVKQRDRYSIELKFRYLLNRKSRRSKYTYNVNIYFFLPYSFNIRPGTYDRSSFYDEMKLYLRFNTPSLPAEELLNPESEISPLARLESMVREARETGSLANADRFIYEGKLLACIYKSLLRDGFSGLSSGHTPGKPEEPVHIKSTASFKEIREIARRFHRLTKAVTENIPDISPDIIEHTKMIDEHLSLLVEKYLTSLLSSLNIQETQDQYTKVKRIILKEIKYRNKSGYPTVAEENPETGHLEEYIYREKMLKHYASEALFFDVRRKNTGKGLEQILYALAAGIAMIFATTAAFLGQSSYGRLSRSLFIILVISYMAKDRIKDFFRDILRKSLGSFFFDRRSNLYDTFHKKKLAVIKERTYFAKEKKIDKAVLKARARGSFERILSRTAGESIFTYNKRINLNSKILRDIHNRIIGLADINIIDLSRFFRHLAVQESQVPSSSENGDMQLHKVRRIYHATMIIQIRKGTKVRLSRYRLVVNAKGIKRIEHVSLQSGAASKPE